MIRLLTNLTFEFSKRLKPNKPLQIPFKKWDIVRGDKVMIRSGSDKGKVSKVMRVFRRSNQVTVSGVNKKDKKQKTPTRQYIIKKRSYPIHVSNVGLWDNQAKKAVRVKYAFHPETNQKLRISKKTGRVLKKPQRNHLKRQKRGRNKKVGLKDTPIDKVQQVTYLGEDFQAIKKQFELFISEKEKRQKMLVFKE